MDNYQIYDEIGKGKYSTVYKGRKKKTIEYVAIKSVDKQHKAKVLNEVKIMHNLDHANVLKFHNWYETNNHYWIILEFCTGGDLLTLLMQDNKMPEMTVHRFGLDLIEGLQYIHSKGVLYCDLKPSNILIDGYGILKYSDFGLSQKVKEGVPLSEARDPARPRRGTPCYMAPELFRDQDCYTMASDFWALGCVLYELASGSPPFESNNFEELMDMILSMPLRKVEGHSEEFNDLVSCLLSKDPGQRPTWQDLRDHPFWKEDVPALTIPAFMSAAVDAAAAAYRPPEKKPQLTTSQIPGLDQQNAGGAAMDVARLSTIFKKQQSEVISGDGDNDGQAQPLEEKHASRKLADLELDFGEPDDGTAGDSPTGLSAEDGSPARPRMPASKPMSSPSPSPSPSPVPTSTLNHQHHVAPAVAHRPVPIATSGRPASASQRQLSIDKLMFHSSDVLVRPIILNSRIEKTSDAKFDSRALPFPGYTLKEFLELSQTDTERFLIAVYKSIGGQTAIAEKLNTLCYFEQLCTDTSAANLLINSSLTGLFTKMLRAYSKTPALRMRLASVVGLLVRHATFISNDLAATGIVGALYDTLKDKNVKVKRRAIACLGELLFYISTSQQQQQQQQQPQGGGPAENSMEMLWGINSSVLLAIVRCLRTSEDEIVQHYAAKALENITASNVEYTQQFYNTGEYIPTLCALFTAATNEHLKGSVISALSRLARHIPSLATQIIERIGLRTLTASLSGASATTRIQQSVLNLLNITLAPLLLFQSTHPSSNSPSGAAAAGRLPGNGGGPPVPMAGLPTPGLSPGGGGNPVIAAHKLLSAVCDDPTSLQQVVKMLDNTSSVVRCKAVVTMYLLCRHCSTGLLLQLFDTRLLLYVDKLLKDNRDSQLKASVDHLCRGLADTIRPLSEQLAVDLETVEQSSTPPAAASSSPLRASNSFLTNNTGNGAVSGINGGGGGSGAVLASLLPTMRMTIELLLHIFTTVSVRGAVLSDVLIATLSRCVKRVDVLPESQLEVKRTLLLAVEALCQSNQQQPTPLLPAFNRPLVEELLPALLSLLQSDSTDTRFLCLKIVTDIFVRFSSQPSLGSTRLDELVREGLLVRYRSILSDEDPIPLYGLKLLSHITEYNAAYIASVPRLGLMPKLFEFFELEHRNNNVHNAKLILKLIAAANHPLHSNAQGNGNSGDDDVTATGSGSSVATEPMYRLGVVGKLNSVLTYAVENWVDSFFEPCLAIAQQLLIFAARMRLALDLPSGASSLLTTATAGSHPMVTSLLKEVLTTTGTEHADPSWLLADKKKLREGFERVRLWNEPLVTNLPVFLQLCSHTDSYVAQYAAQCIVLCCCLYSDVANRSPAYLQPDDFVSRVSALISEAAAALPSSPSSANQQLQQQQKYDARPAFDEVVCRSLLQSVLVMLSSEGQSADSGDAAVHSLSAQTVAELRSTLRLLMESIRRQRNSATAAQLLELVEQTVVLLSHI